MWGVVIVIVVVGLWYGAGHITVGSQFSNGAIREVQYNELEHVQLTEDFLNNPDSFLRHL